MCNAKSRGVYWHVNFNKMAKMTEKCPRCGKMVEGKIIRSDKNRKTRETVKKYAPVASKFLGGSAVNSILPGFGKIVGGVAATKVHTKYKKEIDGFIDKAGDLFEDTFLIMDYKFKCSKCGYTWTSNSANGVCYDMDNNNYEEEIDFSSMDDIMKETLLIIIRELNCSINDIHSDTFIRELGATNIQCTCIKVDLENTFSVEIPSDFLDNNTVLEIINAIYSCKNPSDVLEEEEDLYDEEDDNDEQNEYMDRDMYEIKRMITSVQHYCISIINSQPEGNLDYTQLVNRINYDTKASIAAWQIKDENRWEVVNKLTHRLLSNKNLPDAFWYNLVKTLPQHGENSDDYIMEVYETAYVEDAVEPFGNTVIGVNISGTINVGDTVVLCTYEDEHYEAHVSWIEMLGRKCNSAESGDTIGLGVDIDLSAISEGIDRVYKYDEYYDLNGDEEENDAEDVATTDITSEEQEYINELKDVLSDGDISPRERRLLDKIRTQLGIAEERAEELEASLATPTLTSEEQEYIDEYKEIISNGEIFARDQRYLEKLKKANGISNERAKELEIIVSGK